MFNNTPPPPNRESCRLWNNVEKYGTAVVYFLLGNPPCLNFKCPPFRVLCLFHLHRRICMKDPSYISAYEDGTECSEMSAYKIQKQGNFQKKPYDIQNTAKSLKSRMVHPVRLQMTM
jgi:hypothetical protein